MTEAIKEVTHIEIRRVQNGFVLAGINLNMMEANRLGDHGPQRATFIAKDVPELANLLQWIIDGSDMKWLPTMDLPVWDMERRIEFSKRQQAASP